MSALGQKQTFERAFWMSALPPRADIFRGGGDVRNVPEVGIDGLSHNCGLAMPQCRLT